MEEGEIGISRGDVLMMMSSFSGSSIWNPQLMLWKPGWAERATAKRGWRRRRTSW